MTCNDGWVVCADFLEALVRVGTMCSMPDEEELRQYRVNDAYNFFERVAREGSGKSRGRRASSVFGASHTRPIGVKVERVLELVRGRSLKQDHTGLQRKDSAKFNTSRRRRR